mmetsp:Transcript_16136/g.38598  ORF Transcript_16136/g.38598 Transcript_16136/m.38598 type:complete len:94 (-) Transcript_16136:26-307(-)
MGHGQIRPPGAPPHGPQNTTRTFTHKHTHIHTLCRWSHYLLLYTQTRAHRHTHDPIPPSPFRRLTQKDRHTGGIKDSRIPSAGVAFNRQSVRE